MRFENHFDVAAPIDAVWAAVLDVERVAPTVPGARVFEQVGEDALGGLLAAVAFVAFLIGRGSKGR